MTKIAICDTSHFEVVYTLITLFDREDTHITVFTQPSAFEQLEFLLGEKTHRYNWFIKEKEEANRPFINRMFREIKQSGFDLLYLNTVADNFILYAYHLRRLKLQRIFMTIHNINGYFNYQPSLSLRRLVRYVGKRRLLRIVNEFTVLSEGLALHLRACLGDNMHIYTVPGSCFNPGHFIKKEYQAKERIQITIPGSVDTRRRNYQLVFQLLATARERGINISVTLLGNFSREFGDSIKEQCIAYNSREEKNLFYYDSEIVPQKDFDKVISESHFIWMPSQAVAIISDGIEEVYGQSICSGNTGDIIRFARPFFAPSGLDMDTPLQEARLSYTNVDGILQSLRDLTPAIYGQLQEASLRASMYYTREKIIERTPRVFL